MNCFDKTICEECINNDKYKGEAHVTIMNTKYSKYLNRMLYIDFVLVVGGGYSEEHIQCDTKNCRYVLEHTVSENTKVIKEFGS